MSASGRRKIEAVLPATPLQEGMLVECLRAPGAGLYVNQLACRVTGPLRAELFAEAWRRVVAARPELRASFVWKSQERPLAPVHRRAEAQFSVVDWCAHDDRPDDLLADLLEADRRRGVDPARPPLLRNTLVRLSPDEHLWLWTHHHLILDGWSMPLVLADVFAVYRALVAGEEPRLVPRPPFAAYLAWLKSRDAAAAEAFWRDHLDGFAEPLSAPADGPLPAREAGTRSRVRRLLPPAVTDSLGRLARDERSTLGQVLQVALAVLLGRRAGADDVAFGLTVSGRPPEIPGVETMLGLFINTVPVRLRLSGDGAATATGRSVLATVGEIATRRAGHEHVPLVEVQGWSDAARDRALVEVLLVVENQPLERSFGDQGPGAGELAVEPLAVRGQTGMPLLVVAVPGERLELVAEHDARLSVPGAGRLLAQMETVLAALAAEPDRAVEALPLLAAAERHQLLREWSAGPEPPVAEAGEELLHRLALGTPSERTALVWGAERWSRRQLAAVSGRLARELLRQGLCDGGRELPVGIFLRRTARLPVALLAVLRAGGVYVPLDSDAPAERLATVATDVAAAFGVDRLPVLTEEALLERLPDGPVRPVPVDGLGIDLADRTGGPMADDPGLDFDLDLPAERLAYVITTSGSTGRPKGVAIPHRAASAMVRWALGAFSARELAGTLAATSVTFDLSVFELFVPLAAGGTVILADDALALASRRSLPARDEVTLVNTVPSAARELARLGAIPDSVETLNLAGEPVTGELVREIHRRFPGVARVHDLYGPSEDTTYSTGALASDDARAGREPSIGRPVAGTRAFVVDALGRPTALGEVGELLLAGAGLTRGYLGRPRETAESYRPDPFSGPGSAPGGRVYHTGDLVRHLPDGRLAFLGRRDHQVKLRGFRIELGEIQVALESDPAVAEAVVAAREDRRGDRRLVAWVVPSEGVDEARPDALAEGLRRRLPAYMVPAAWVVLDVLPRLVNGKVDRRRLLYPEVGPEVGPEAGPEVPGTSGETGRGPADEPPATDTERVLAETWRDLLGLEPGRRDSFFALGGHSLLITRLAVRVQKATGVRLELDEWFRHPVLADQAALLDRRLGLESPEDFAAAEGSRAIEPLERTPEGPPVVAPLLAPAQERLWMLHRLDPESSAYHMPATLALTGPLDVAALARALAGLVVRHELLRTRFVPEPDGSARLVGEPTAGGVGPGLPVVDLSGLPVARRETAAGRGIEALSARPFDLEGRGPVRWALLRRSGPGDHLLCTVFHHLVSDGWSVRLVVEEIGRLYRAAVEGVAAELPPLPIQYADWAAADRRRLDEPGELDRSLDWWRETLDQAAGRFELPWDRPLRPGARPRSGVVRLRLEADLRAGVERLARRLASGPFAVLAAAWGHLLARSVAADGIVLGTASARRDRPEVSGLVGFFVETVPLRLAVPGDDSLAAISRRTASTTREALAHQGVPFDRLAEAVGAGRDGGGLAQVMFAFQEDLVGTLPDLPGVELELLPGRCEEAKFELLLELASPVDRGTETAGWVGRLEYRRDLFDPTTAVRLARRFVRLLERSVAEPERPLGQISLLSAAERAQTLVEWSQRGHGKGWEPVGETVPQRVLRRWRGRPDALAIEGAGERLTGADLDAVSELWARRLVAVLGPVGPADEPVVAVLGERSPEVVAAYLGVWRAGGVYQPLDPTLPDARLAVMVADSRARAVVGCGELAGRAAALAADVGAVAVSAAESAAESADELPPLSDLLEDPRRLAYVIYTSGSTGTPKGVAVDHRSLLHMVRWNLELFGLRPGERVSHTAGLGFDASVWDLWTALVAGASLHQPSERERTEPAALVGWMAREGIHLGFVSTAMVEVIVDAPWPDDAVLRVMLTGGDALKRRPLAAADGGPGYLLVNGYGPTETTVVAVAEPVAPRRSGSEAPPPPPIGRPVPGARATVVDRALRPVPIGHRGELVLGGPGVSRGYLGRPAETAERFLPDPFSGEVGARLYRTGDGVRWLADGRLDFLGRLDRQVQVRGLRIEPAEIEAVLLALSEVSEAVVGPDADASRLIAWWVPADGVADDPAPLDAALRARLPAWMVPSVWVTLGAMPLGDTGKVDRRALPEPEVVRRSGPAPRTETERAVAGLWAELLETDEPVAVDESFFDLGGHSLLALRLAGRLGESFGVEVELRRLIERPTVAEMAAWLDRTAGRGDGGLETVQVADRSLPLPLAAAQERLWFLDRLEGERSSYHVPGVFALRGSLRPAWLASALGAVTARHEALRTRFVEMDGQPRQEILPPAPVALPMIDLTALDASRRAAEGRRWTDRLVRLRFDLARGRLARFVILRTGAGTGTGNDEHRLLVVFHHLVSDGWSVGIFAREVAALYAAAATGTPATLAPLALAPVDWAVHERRRLAAGQADGEAAWWREFLDGAPRRLDLPTDRPRRAGRTTDGGTVPWRLASGGETIARLARRLGATPFAVVTAAWGLWLGRSAGVDDLLVGTPSARRDRPELQGLFGFFVDTLPLRLDLAGEPTFADLVARCRATLTSALAHRELPFERIVAAVAPERDRSSHPLVQAVVAYQETTLERLELPGLTLEAVPRPGRTAKFDLTLQAAGTEAGDLACGLEYSADLFDRETVERFARRLEGLFEAALASPETPAWALPVMDEAERRQLLDATAAGPRVDLDGNDDLAGRFRAVARRAPGAPAVSDADGTWSYGELARRARGIALALGSLEPEEPVALLVERSAAMVAAVLGILEAGGAYLPLEPGHPDGRLEATITDAGARRAVVSRSLAPRLRGLDALELLVVEDVAPATEAETAAPPPAAPLASRTAYVIYTSGSTGRPKGTPVPHDRVLRLFDATRGWFPEAYAERSVWSLFHSIAFDFSVWELWGALLHGGRVVVVPRETARAPGAFLELVRRQRVTVLSQTPSAFSQLVRADVAAGHPSLALETVVFGGEALDLGGLRPWVEARGWDRPRLVNMYGITETTVHVTYRVLTPADFESAGRSPLGVAIPDLAVRVLDAHARLVPPGVAGELCVAGAGLARGYLGRPALTAERFVPDPFAAVPGERLYRSGDLARWTGSSEPDGLELDYLGRLDHQVSIRGFRVELGEVEAALAARPEVAEAVVAVRGDRLVAWVVPGATDAEVDVAALRSAVGERLPDYMVPAAIAPVDAFPLTANGKVDRAALPDPFAAGRGGESGRAPAGAVEEAVAAVWAEVLERPVNDASASFFDLGGHSLLAVRAVSRLEERLGVDVAVQTLFEQPTVGGLAAVLEPAVASAVRATATKAPIPRCEGPGPFPLSPGQERLWFLDRLEPGGTAYLMPLALALAGSLDRPALAVALTRVVRRHGALRSHFPDGVQVVAAPEAVPLPVVDLTSLPAGRAEIESRRLRRAEEATGFDLARGPLVRARLVVLDPERSLFLLTVHHIVSDGMSNAVLVRDLETFYRRQLGEETPDLPALDLRYGDWAAWTAGRLASGELDGSLAWWRERLADVPDQLDLPTDRPRRPTRGETGTGMRFELSESVAGLLATRARETGASRFMVFLAAFGALLGRLAGTDRLVVGTPVANRTRPRLESLMGFFVDTLALPVDLAGDPTFDELIGRVRETVLGAFDHAELPFGRLVEALQPERSLDRTPLFQVLLAWQNVGLPRLELPGVEATPLGAVEARAKFDLTLGIEEGSDESGSGGGGALPAGLVAAAELFDPTTVRRLVGSLQRLIRGALEEPGRRLSELPLLAVAERHQILHEWDGGRELPPAPGGAPGGATGGVELLHALALAPTAGTPDSTALVWGAERWSRRRLARDSGRLARALVARGICGPGAERPVGVCLERTSRLPVALLAVLRAGGAYVPLTPDTPPERLATVAADLAAATGLERLPVLTSSDLAERLPRRALEVVVLEELDLVNAPDDETFAVPLHPDRLAYVITTSGSTGRPKGVAIPHRAAAAMVRWALGAFSREELAGTLAATAVTFDLSVFELFVPLAAGGTVILADDALALASSDAVPARDQVTLVNTVPSAARELVRLGALPPSVVTVNLAGEPLPGELVRQIHSAAPAVRRVSNLYGPSEDTTYSTRGRASDDVAGNGAGDGREPTVGRAVDGTRARVVDPDGRPVPAGVVGELWLSGAGLARGYLGRPRETAASFRPDPFSGARGGRVYQTGDLVRWLADGRLDFLGRRDHQVKVRGYRIELGEIEVALGEQEGVGQAVVAAVPGTSGTTGGTTVPGTSGEADRRLVAWVEVGEAAAVPGSVVERLRGALARRLPAYMVPAAWVVLDRLPRLPNGKIDRRALPALGASPEVPGTSSAPSSEEVPGTSGGGPPATVTERFLAELWRELLGAEPGRSESFFALGGHSLLAARLVAGLRSRTGVEVPLRQVFETPTLAALATALEDLGASVAQPATADRSVVRPLARRPDGTPVTAPPLAPNQLRLWFLDRLEGGSAAYHLPLVVSLAGRLERPAFADALTRLVERHEALRTAFVDGDDGPVLDVRARLVPRLPVVDLAALPPARATREGDRLAADLAAVPLRLSRAPLARFALVATAPDEHRFVIVQHHAITDGWSLGVLVEDLGAFYRQALGGEAAAPVPLTIQPSDWAAHLADRLTDDRVGEWVDWWRQRLDDPSRVLELPADRPRRRHGAVVSDTRPARSARSTRVLSAELSRAVSDLTVDQGATLFMVLLSALQTVLWRWTGERRPTVGTAVAGRTAEELRPLAGYFVNTVVVPGDLEPEPGGDAPSFARLLARVRETALGAFERQELPFERLVEALDPRRDPDRTPLFSVFLNLLNYERRRLELPGLDLEQLPTPEPPAKFDLTLYAGERDDGRVALSAVYPAARFDAARIEAFLAQMERLLEGAMAAPNTPVDRLPLAPPEVPGTSFALSSAEAPEVFPEVPGTSGEPGKSVVWRLSEQVGKTPDAPAVVAEDGTVWSYRELDRRSARVAEGLLAGGLGRGQTVAVVLPRSPELVAALVGVARAGGAFAVLDPALPAPARERRLAVLRRHGVLGAVLEGGLDEMESPRPELGADLDGDDAFSVTFTSGSTGTPRAILTRHAPVAEFVDWYADAIGLGPGDRVAVLSGLGHDPLVRDVFAPLAVGASLAVPGGAVHGEPRRLARWLTRSDAGREVTVAHLTPSLGRVLALGASAAGGVAHETLRRVLFGGERVETGDLTRLATWAPHARAAAVYGATETPQVMAWREIDPSGNAGPVGLGRGIDGVELRLVGRSGGSAALGELAEIQVATPRLACGYLGDPRATAERFRPDPRAGVATAPGGRVYRTGDLGRREPDGTVSFAGRGDRQLSVRGHRLEPAEVEAALAEHPAVAQAVVRPVDPGDPTSALAAWVVPAAGSDEADLLGGDLAEGVLERHLAERLPAWMTPSVVVAIPSLPLTPNGKLDLAALSAPAVLGDPTVAFVAPRTDTEEAVAGLFARVLELDAPVGVHDDFFRLGGHSIKATRLTAAIAREMGVEIPLAALFGASTVAGLAVEVERLRPESLPESLEVPGTSGDPPNARETWPLLVPLVEERGEPFPLTDIQEAYWVGRSGAFELGSVSTHSYLEIDSRSLDLDRFEHAWNRLVERHAMLRAVFLDDGTQRILPAASEGGPTTYRVALADLTDSTERPADEVRRHLDAVRDELSHQVLDVTRWPVFELRASRFEATALDPSAAPGPVTRLHVSRDALLYDAWSSGLLADELLLFYVEPDAEPEPLEVTFREYVLAERALRETDRYARDLAYWQGRLPTLPPGPELPLARDPESIDAPRFERRSARLDEQVWERLRERITRAGLTPSGALLAAYAEVLATWSKEPRFTINLTLFNRLPVHPQVDRLVGDFTSVTLLEVDDRPPEGSTDGAGNDFAGRARRLQERLWTDLDHRLVSGVAVLRELARSRRGVRMPVVFTSTLTQDQRTQDQRTRDQRTQNGRPTESAPLAGRGEGLGEVAFSITQTPQVWLDHQVGERDGALVFNWDAVEGLFPDGLLDAMFGAYVELLHRLADEPAAWRRAGRALTPSEELELMSAAHRAAPPVAPRLLHEAFVEHALAEPDRLAVVAADRHLDRGTLYRESRALARQLRSRGVVPGELVAVALAKGWRQVVAVLAVLQAGGAYLPVDPEQPAERLGAILRQGPVRLALVEGDREELPGADPRQVELIPVEPNPEPAPGCLAETLPAPLPPAQTVDDLAYVIFTSGSTGTPKGVAMEHRAVWNTLADLERRFHLGPDDRVLALSRLSFDLSVWDVFGVLSVGGALVCPKPAEARDPEAWHRLVTEHRVTVWNTVPALAEMWVQWALAGDGAPTDRPKSLRLALLSGDWIPLDLPARLGQLVGGPLQVVSLGGATEAAIWSILHPVDGVEPGWTSIPYGRPMDHQGWRVLDPRGEPRPFHVPGELHIAGAGLARGYHGAPELTAAAFVVHPQDRPGGERLYRTGDLGRWRPGEGDEPPWIEFLGREDSQVKVGGYRIELGEIEAALVRLPGVREAVAGVAGARRGATRLAAWVVPESPVADGTREERGAALRQGLGHLLPAYMVPAAVLFVDRIPLTANGKVDRAALPRPEAVAMGEGFVAPRTELEARLARLWAEHLALDGGQVGVHDDFFELGGDSVLAIRIVTRARQEGLELGAAELFRNPTVAELAAVVETADEASAEGGASEGSQEVSDAEAAGLSEDELDDFLASITGD